MPDTHFSSRSDQSPWSDRMHRAFAAPRHWATQQPTSTRKEFLEALALGESLPVDLIAIGGDLVNFPSEEQVNELWRPLDRPQNSLLGVYLYGTRMYDSKAW